MGDPWERPLGFWRFWWIAVSRAAQRLLPRFGLESDWTGVVGALLVAAAITVATALMFGESPDWPGFIKPLVSGVACFVAIALVLSLREAHRMHEAAAEKCRPPDGIDPRIPQIDSILAVVRQFRTAIQKCPSEDIGRMSRDLHFWYIRFQEYFLYQLGNERMVEISRLLSDARVTAERRTWENPRQRFVDAADRLVEMLLEHRARIVARQ